VNVGKAIAFARQKPLIGVNHLESHIYANWLIPQHSVGDEVPLPPQFPLICLVVSGGHSEIVLIRDHNDYKLLGKTQDDAAGEAFDKVARVMGLGYPGGPLIEKAAQEGDPTRFAFPRAWLRGTYDFSFSGLKTAVLHKVEEYQAPPPKPAPFSGAGVVKPVPTQPKLEAERASRGKLPTADIAASFQEAVVEVLASKTVQAAQEYKATRILIAGGVAANKALRRALNEHAEPVGIPVSYPAPVFCTDNAAMVGAAAYYRLQKLDKKAPQPEPNWGLDILPNWQLV
jgi:N6-L-threonylcarbamoyladenine synthase